MKSSTWAERTLVARLRFTALSLLIPLLAGCTAVRFEGVEGRIQLSPDQVMASGFEQGGTVVWGGRILAVDNFEDGTELQILAFPLSGGNVPNTGKSSEGRFVAYFQGFLEPVDYAAGRYVSLAGELQGVVEGQVGESKVRFPLVQTSRIHLWPKDKNP